MIDQKVRKSDKQNTVESLKVLFPEPCVVEVRVPKAGTKGVISGYFELPSHLSAMAAAVEEVSGDFEGIYWTINPVTPALLARANNKLHQYVKTTTADSDVIRRNWLPFDFDPKRPTGISSSVEEKEAAQVLIRSVRKWLNEMGWPDPVIADSGNGYHALYKIDLPNDDASRDLLKSVLEAVAARFDTEVVKVDTKVFNAARIMKAYGSMACKGDDIPQRPHRIAKMFAPPAVTETVTVKQLKSVSALLPKPGKKENKEATPNRGGGWTDTMVEAGLTAAGREFKPPLSYKDGLKWQHACFDYPEEHRAPDCFTMRDKDGWVSSKCSHNSCGDGLNSARWVAKVEELAGHEIEKPMHRKYDVVGLLASLGAENVDAPCSADVGYDRETDCPLQRFDLNDFGNAERFEWRYGGRFLHTGATGWLVYGNGRWQKDKTSAVEQGMWNTIRLIKLELKLADGPDEEDDILEFADDSESSAGLRAALTLAAGRPCFSRNYADFDQQPDLFLCANGTIHLDTGEFGPFDPKHLLTKGSDVRYEPEANCPQWEKFVLEVMDEKVHMVEYLRRSGGYSLSANTGEQCLFVPFGCGGTGKTTFINVLQGVMGTYCQIADPEMLMAKKGDSGQPFEMAGMEGTRALFATETEKGKTLALSKLKRMSGQEGIRASYKGRDHYTFVPNWKLWLATNDEPSADASDDAFWERVKVIPFNVKFRNTDRQIRDLHVKLLSEESSGILNWFLAGHGEWKRNGLQHPAEVSIAVKEWQETEDYLGRCLAERFQPTTNPTEFVLKTEAFAIFDRWSATSKEGEGISLKEFTKQMRAKAFVDRAVKRDGKTVRVWMGLTSRSSSENRQELDPEKLGLID